MKGPLLTSEQYAVELEAWQAAMDAQIHDHSITLPPPPRPRDFREAIDHVHRAWRHLWLLAMPRWMRHVLRIYVPGDEL